MSVVATKVTKVPGPDHPIDIARANGRVVVKLAGETIADSREALVLKEAAYPGVYYIPRMDVHMALLQRTTHGSYCPYKGDASYYSIHAGERTAENAVWSYEMPYAAVEEIKDCLAFYPDRVDSIEILPEH